MRVRFWPADKGACAFYRCAEPARVLKAQGHDVENNCSFRTAYEGNAEDERPHPADVDADFDVVVLARPLLREQVELIPAFQARGIAVVAEIDDDFTRIHRDNYAWSLMQPETSPDINYKWALKAAKTADAVIVTTPALAKTFVPDGKNVHVIPNYIPQSYIDIGTVRTEDDRREVLQVGWTGTVRVHPTDLQVIGSLAGRTITETGAWFVHVGPQGEEVAKLLHVPPDRFLSTGWVPLERYPKVVAALDVGLVPLANTQFNQGKSWLKGLEYAALGVPFVASPTAAYDSLVNRGIGAIATRPRDWQKALRMLLTNVSLWHEEREHNRQGVAELTYERNAWRWMEVFERALRHRRAQPRRSDPFEDGPPPEKLSLPSHWSGLLWQKQKAG